MIQLLYISEAAVDLSESELQQILETSRRNNARHNITGFLIYHAPTIFQILEGEEEEVQKLFNVIKKDTH